MIDQVWSSSVARYIGIFGLYIVYLLIGSSIFDAIENPSVHNRIQLLEQGRNRFLRENPCLDRDSVDSYVDEVLEIMGHSNVTRPSYITWLFFASTLVTTIGYGQVPPLSYGSKAFAICFCTLGVPFTLILLKTITEKLMDMTSQFLEYLNRRLGHLYRPVHIRLLHAVLITTTCVLLVFLLPAAVFSAVEPEWTFLDSLYYSYMTVTTIGVVDVLPSSRIQNVEAEAVYKIFVLLYIFFGLCFTLLCLAIINEIPQINFLLRFLHPSPDGFVHKKMTNEPTENSNLVTTKTIHKHHYMDRHRGDGDSNFSRQTSISFSSDNEN